MWAGLQDRIDDRFTPLFDAEKNCKNLYELFIDRATILILKIIFDIFHDTLPLTSRGAHVNCATMAMLYTHAIGNQP